jgi:hypothetical protein
VTTFVLATAAQATSAARRERAPKIRLSATVARGSACGTRRSENWPLVTTLVTTADSPESPDSPDSAPLFDAEMPKA